MRFLGMLGVVAILSAGCLERQAEAPGDAAFAGPDGAADPAQIPDRPQAPEPSDADRPVAPLQTGRIEVAPAAVDFGAVTPHGLQERWIEIGNSGPGVLTVREVEILGDDAGAFGLIVGIPHLVRIVRGYEPLRVQVGFRPPAAGRMRAWLRIRSDDPVRPDVRVELVGDGAGRCLTATPEQMHFPELSPGDSVEMDLTLTSCGRSPSHVRSVGLAPGTSYAYSLVDGRPHETELPPGESLAVTVQYQPSLPGIDAGRLEVKTDGVPGGVLYVDLIARARPDDRPVAPPRCQAEVETPDGDWELVDDGALVRREGLSELGLRATESLTEAPEPLGFAWRVVDSPRSSLTSIQPDPRDGEIYAHLDLLGEYVFEVRVFDAAGQEDICRVAVRTSTRDDLYVETVWDTPLDPVVGDNGPDVGANVDVHVRTPSAQGWFCAPGDAYAANPGPDWGTPQRSDDDPVVIDDRDGWGPEVFRLAHAQDGDSYRIAAHYADDASFGASIATSRVFVRGELRLELTRRFTEGMFWDVAVVHWPSGEVDTSDWLREGPETVGCADFKGR